MKWTPGGRSDDIEDIRGQPASGGGGRGLAVPLTGGGIAIAIVLALLSQVFGVNLTGGGDDTPSTQQAPSQQRAQQAQQPRSSAPKAGDPDEREMQFISFVLDDVQKTFEKMFQARGLQYR